METFPLARIKACRIGSIDEAWTSQSIWWLLAARVCQGLGTATWFVTSLSIVSNAFSQLSADKRSASGRERGRSGSRLGRWRRVSRPREAP